MSKNKFWVICICLLVALSTVLSACGGAGDNGDGTTGTKKPSKTTDRTEATTAATEQMVTANNLVPEIQKADQNQVLVRLNPPLTVNIDENTTIDLDYQGWPTICKGDGDTIYAVSSARKFHVDPFGAVIISESHDKGETWSEARIVVDTPVDDRDAGIVYLGNGKMLVSWFIHASPLYIEGDYSHWRNNSRVTDEQEAAVIKRLEALPIQDQQAGSFVILSEDYGQTWGDIVRVPISAPHGPSLMQDGKTLVYLGHTCNPTSAGFSNMTGQYLYIMTSNDCGKNWKLLGSIKKEVGANVYCEPHIIQLTDGSFVAAVRVHDDPTDANAGMHIQTATSLDGRTWTTLKRVSDKMLGGPAHLLQLSNGVVLMVYGYRDSQCGNRYRLSYDGGKTWGKEMVLNVSDTPANADLGYPSTVELSDGTLITAYYQTYKNDKYPSFLYTKWKLTEAEAE